MYFKYLAVRHENNRWIPYVVDKSVNIHTIFLIGINLSYNSKIPFPKTHPRPIVLLDTEVRFTKETQTKAAFYKISEISCSWGKKITIIIRSFCNYYENLYLAQKNSVSATRL